jgi:TolB protein
VYDANPDRRTFDIYAVRLETGKREVVAGQASQPAISFDGQRLAYRSWDRGQRGLMVLELTDGHAWRWIEFAEAARPNWSPDDQNIVFPSRQESDRRWRIYRTIGLEFTLIRRHGGDIFGRVPIWLSDGRIVYWDCPLDKCGLYVMHSDGTDPLRLTTAEHDTGPAASPDGQRVAFMSNRSGNWEVYVVDSTVAEGAETRQLTQNAARDGLPTFSPDGKWIAFVSDRGGTWAVWAIRPDGSDLQKLFALGGSLEGEIAYAQPDEQGGWTSETMAWGP